MSEQTPGMALLTSPVRRQILDVLAQLPVQATPKEPKTRRDGLTAAELGARIGLHVTTIRFHVDQLLEAGLVCANDISNGVEPQARFSPARRFLRVSASSRSACDSTTTSGFSVRP